MLVLMHLRAVSDEMLGAAFAADFGPAAEPEPVPLARADALRDLGMGCQILVDHGLAQLRLLTNSSRPIVGLEAYGLSIVDRVSLEANPASGGAG